MKVEIDSEILSQIRQLAVHIDKLSRGDHNSINECLNMRAEVGMRANQIRNLLDNEQDRRVSAAAATRFGPEEQRERMATARQSLEAAREFDMIGEDAAYHALYDADINFEIPTAEVGAPHMDLNSPAAKALADELLDTAPINPPP